MQKMLTAALSMVLVAGTCFGLDKETSLVTGKKVGNLAVAGKLLIDVHAEFMMSRTFENDTVLHWYNMGVSGGGRVNKASGGSFGDFGLHVPYTQRDEKYPHAVTIGNLPAAKFDGGDLVFVSPDIGGVLRTRGMAKRLDADLAIIDKRRERAGESEVMNIIGDVEGRRCIIVDDIVDSAGTLCNAAQALKDAGAAKVSAHISHGVFSGEAVLRIENSVLDLVTVTDSIQPSDVVLSAKNIRVIPIAPLMAEAMSRISEESSVSSLFD